MKFDSDPNSGAGLSGSGSPIAGALPVPLTWDSVLPRLQEALFGEFVISRELGRGGMAAVFLAHQLRLDRKVAIKVMAPSLMSEPGLVERFRDEATTVAGLDHPNIISIFEVGSAAQLQYFVMQYVPGRSLERATRQHGPLPFDIVRALVLGIGEALAFAHRHQVIHRDVKPGNVLLSLDGRVIVGDFGIAKAMTSTGRTQTGAVIGTPAYMSPEQCLARPLTWSSDQYSLGVVTYELVTGVQPFVGPSHVVMRSHTVEPPPPVLSRRPDCPRNLATAIERMLSKEPEDRFASMADALMAMGATRAHIAASTDQAIGHLAIPLPSEEGIVLVHTPVSPVPPARSTGGLAAALSTIGSVALNSNPESTAHRAARRTAAALALMLMAIVAIVVARELFEPRASRLRGAGNASLGDTPVPVESASRDSLRRDGDSSATVGAASPPGDSIAIDSLAVHEDSAAATLVVVRPRATIQVDDSLELAARVLDRRGDRVRARVRWRVTNRALATVDSMTGVLRAVAPGRVRVVATTDSLVASTTITITSRARPAPASNEGSADRATHQPTTIVDYAAEQEMVADVLAAFVRSVLINKDVDGIRRLYQTPSAADIGARDSLIAEIVANPRLSIVPPGSSPPPAFSGGESSTAKTRLTLRNTRARKREPVDLWIQAELRRDTGAWTVIGFRITPAPR